MVLVGGGAKASVSEAQAVTSSRGISGYFIHRQQLFRQYLVPWSPGYQGEPMPHAVANLASTAKRCGTHSCSCALRNQLSCVLLANAGRLVLP